MPPEPDADLHWTAFLYVAGELPPGEEAAFERRLADDQAAREAVAGAVELAGTLAALGPEAWAPPRARRHPARRALAWSAMAMAACLAVATAWALRSAPKASPDAAEVAMAWSGLRRLDAIGGEVDAIDLVDESTATGPDPAVDLDAPTGPALPSWLLTAASAPRDDAPPQQEN